MNNELVELLAEYEHKRWVKWQSYLFSKSFKNDDGSVTIPKELVDRWNRQIETNYSGLSESEKESDRNCAKELIKILKLGYKNDSFNLQKFHNCNVGFDIDYTLTKDEGFYKNYIDNYLKKNNLNYKYIENTKYIDKMYDWPKGEYMNFKQNEFVNLMSALPLNKNTKKFIEHLKNNNCNIYIITGRNKNNEIITKNWLKKHNICYKSIVFGDKYKLQACKDLKIDYFFDDNSKVVDLLNKNRIKAYLVDEIERLYYE